jgi:hypothetical protein
MRKNDDNRTILVFKGLKLILQLVFCLWQVCITFMPFILFNNCWTTRNSFFCIGSM